MLLRNLWFYLWLLLSTPFFSLTAILFSWQKNGRISSWAGCTWARTLLWAAGVRWTADLSTLPPPPSGEQDKGLVFMANHLSQTDILILYALLGKYRPVYIAKQSLFSIPLFGQAMSAAGHIPIDRSNQRKAMRSIDAAAESLEQGRSVIIFPEGTRNLQPERLAEFKIGGMVLALKCQQLVCPIILKGTRELLPKGSILLPARQKPVLIKALPPVDSKNYVLKQRELFKEDLYTLMNDAYLELNVWENPANM